MRFMCPKCGIITSSEMSLSMGGYWNKYSRNGPWGCPMCRIKLDRKCEKCGVLGASKTSWSDEEFKSYPPTFPNLTCPCCGFEPPFPWVGCLITLVLLIGMSVGIYFAVR